MDLQEVLGRDVDVVTERGLNPQDPGSSIEGSGVAVRDPKERIKDILEAIEHIERYSALGKSRFEQDELIQSWFTTASADHR